MKDSCILEMRGICKTYGAVTANCEVDLTVRAGKVHAIIGENGAGKSTLMNILTDIQKPDAGQIILEGRSVVFKNPRDAVMHGIGMVYQEFMLFPGMSVLDNIILGSEPQKGPFIDYAAARKRIEEICDKYHFPIPLDALVDQLPVAIQQQVEIVKVLYKNAGIIILDEPTSVLTPQGIEGLFEAVRHLVSEGKTVLFITHKLGEVMEIADDITVLKNGRVVGTVCASDTNEAELARMMVGRDVFLRVEKEITQPGEMLLEADSLTVREHRGVQRVKRASFSVRAGEIVGISGIAGSGQKELVEALVGLTPAESGEIRFGGKPITGLTVGQRRKLGIGYVAQDRSGVGTSRESTLWENVVMGFHLLDRFQRGPLLPQGEARQITRKVIANYSVKAQSIDLPIRNLSGGNVQKLLVGREFSQGKKLLVIEDPTRGVDVGAIEFIWKQILDIAKSGVGILLVSHELNEVMQLSDRILVMFNGLLLAPGNSRALSEEELGLWMLGGHGSDRKE